MRAITEKVILEAKLRESEAEYRDLFENAQDPIYTIDINGYFQTINNAGCILLNAAKEEIIGTHISKWLTQQSLGYAKQRINLHASKTAVEEPVVYELVCNDGQHRFAEVRTRPIIKDGSIVGIHGMGRDITGKRILIEKLKESEAKYRDLFENADDPMYTHDENGFFQTINKAGLIQLGCSEKEVVGTHFSKWLTPESYKKVEEQLRKNLAGETIEQPEIIEVVKSNGEHRWGEARISLIKKGGKIIGIQGIVRDITEKRMLEKKVREYHEKLQRSYEELMEADRAKTEFVSNITHELLTPLTSIKGFVELLGEESIGTINPEQKKSLDIILRNSDRLIRLIKELLDSTRLENNRFVMELKNVSLESIILKSIQDIYPQANEKQITLIRETQPLTQIWGDDERLMQVIRNLLINAIKFTPQNGKITIKSSNYNEHVKISISDTGIGISKDKLNTIFERFYQVDGSASRKYGGVGLGLSICKNIIEKHQGSIWAESEGNGSTFHILLPKYRSNTEEQDN